MPQAAEANRESCRKWRAKNREYERARVKAWREANPEKSRAQTKNWLEKSPENYERYLARTRRSCATRKARLLGAFVEPVDHRFVLAQNEGLCGLCWDPVDPQDFHVDHIIPLSWGGEHSYENVQPTHPRCNMQKGARFAA